jgi:hypothetical protein
VDSSDIGGQATGTSTSDIPPPTAASRAVLIFLAFMLAGVVKPVSLQTTMQSRDIVEALFSGLVGAIITGATLVVTINQLVLSQEIGSLGSQRSRMDTALDFRQKTDELLGTTPPTEPAAYLDALIETNEQRARRLREVLSAAGDRQRNDRVGSFVDDLLQNAGHARYRLEDTDFGTFSVLSPALDYDQKMNDLRRLAEQYEADLTNKERTAFRDLL